MALKPEEIEHRFSLLQREIKVSGEDLDRVKAGVVPDIEALKIDIEAFRRLLKARYPEIADEFAKIREEVAREFGSQEKAA